MQLSYNELEQALEQCQMRCTNANLRIRCLTDALSRANAESAGLRAHADALANEVYL